MELRLIITGILLAIGCFFIIVASASTNLIANYVPAQNSLLNFFPSKLNLKTSSYIIVIFGFVIGIFWLPLLSKIGIKSELTQPIETLLNNDKIQARMPFIMTLE